MVLVLPLVANYNQFLQTDISHRVIGICSWYLFIYTSYYLHNAKNSLGAILFRLLYSCLVDFLIDLVLFWVSNKQSLIGPLELYCLLV